MTSSKIDVFLKLNASFLHWSYLNDNWDQEKRTPKAQRKVSTEASCSEKCEKTVRLPISYFAGMIGHTLCLAAKPIMIALFVIVTIGLAIHYAALKLGITGTPLQGNKEVNAFVEIRKTRVLSALFILGESFLAAGVDTIGIVCPPAAYALHEFAHKTFVEKNLKKIGILEVDKTLPFYRTFNDFFGIA